MIRNQKKVIQIALPAVILIWGFVAFELFYFTNKQSTPEQNLVAENYSPPIIQKKERFVLLPTQSDPFLGTVYIKEVKERTKSISKTINKKVPLVWPKISYNGLVSDQNSDTKIFVIDINGIQHLLEAGEEVDNITVIKASRDRVSLKYKNEVKEFSIQ